MSALQPGDAEPVLSVRGLRIAFEVDRVVHDVVHGIDFDAHAGRCLAVVGESGSGKSVSTLALTGLLPTDLTRLRGGTAMFQTKAGRSVDLLALPREPLRLLRGAEIGVVFQDPMTSLNPVLTVGDQLSEGLMFHRGLSRDAARAEAQRWLDRVEIADPAARLRAYPHELSGGMRQRVMIAMALSCEPRLLIADEPTTALDVIVQAQVLALMRRLQKELNAALIFITHDLGVVSEMADEVVVMRLGRVLERGTAREVLCNPTDPYTRKLLDSVPDIGRPAQHARPVRGPDDPVAVEVQGLRMAYGSRASWWRRRAPVVAVQGASLRIYRGETLALVGESGSGKSTLARGMLRLLPAVEGRVVVLGSDISAKGRRAMRPLRRNMQLIFQDPFASLDPRMTIGELLTEPLDIHEPTLPKAEARARAADWMRRVRLPETSLDRFPHEFSGGQRQRIVIARALILGPRFVVADEAVSSLDVSIQAEVLALLAQLQQELGLTLLFITHNLGVVRHHCDRAIVLYRGEIVEEANCEALFSAPQHEYTRRLIAAVPRLPS
ncbi:peptide/nickel transport system ATP-binding protein [Variovorax boronicumulans]|uniref:ABC transporter ATP-binding protein n=1 Tax=Variovorax boronicumulans TaxID=436515 RepID=UPI00278535D5|nr:ABC transporter ATP-binding protein [Variovorax boronicumulans]MDP9995741.1 peptide/nickel transport system ATP-binding protein [Variovorax boronicumulans]MDQ0006794.1 peptide/nickel transport system ATP-binding protein [Variovorax boronicumulans]